MTEAVTGPEPAEQVILTTEVADFLRLVVDSIQLSAGADNFAEQAALIVASKTQLRPNR